MTKLVGILNITPDSFSDGGNSFERDDAIKRAHELLDDGADIIDIGAESTRPGATPLDSDEEWKRLNNSLADIINIAHEKGKLTSIDTRHYQTADKALELGMDIINDVSGFKDNNMIDVVSSSNCKLIAMHSVGVPADPKQMIDKSEDTILFLINWFNILLEQLDKKRINKERIIFDPGIGFGKDQAQSLDIIAHAGRLKKESGVELLIGHSRKSFMKSFAKTKEEKDATTAAISAILMMHKINYLRVHNIKVHAKIRNNITRY